MLSVLSTIKEKKKGERYMTGAYKLILPNSNTQKHFMPITGGTGIWPGKTLKNLKGKMSETGYRCFQVCDSQERYGRTVGDDRMAVEDETRKSSCEVFGLYFIRNGKSKLVF